MNKKASYLSLTNSKLADKPNEDFILIDNERGIFILLDGVSRDTVNGVYPNPSPAALVTKEFANSALSFIASGLDNLKNPKEIDYMALIRGGFEHGNRCIFEKNKSWEDGFLPGTVGIILILQDNVGYFGFIGDCFGMTLGDNGKKVFTRVQTKAVHENKSSYTSYEIRHLICNNFGHPVGYGVLNGNEDALKFVEYGQFSLDGLEQILLYTDGFENLLGDYPVDKLATLHVDEISEMQSVRNEVKADDRSIIIIR